MWRLWKSDSPLTLGIVGVVYSSSCLFSGFSELIICSLYFLLCVASEASTQFIGQLMTGERFP